ncbi:hypothetical protein BKA69DRAFT_1124629 [Paraphysoderma sedebokerense]|nr:hypothetical protein BKA69DRAFT_1124629 [Paraphysoderma sedebokerense]
MLPSPRKLLQPSVALPLPDCQRRKSEQMSLPGVALAGVGLGVAVQTCFTLFPSNDFLSLRRNKPLFVALLTGCISVVLMYIFLIAGQLLGWNRFLTVTIHVPAFCLDYCLYFILLERTVPIIKSYHASVSPTYLKIFPIVLALVLGFPMLVFLIVFAIYFPNIPANVFAHLSNILAAQTFLTLPTYMGLTAFFLHALIRNRPPGSILLLLRNNNIHTLHLLIDTAIVWIYSVFKIIAFATPPDYNNPNGYSFIPAFAAVFSSVIYLLIFRDYVIVTKHFTKEITSMQFSARTDKSNPVTSLPVTKVAETRIA